MNALGCYHAAASEQRSHTHMNAVEIEQAISDLALQPFDAAEFPFAFLAAFGNKDTTLKGLRAGNNNASDVPGGVLQRNNIDMPICPHGTTGAGLLALRSSAATAKGKAKLLNLLFELHTKMTAASAKAPFKASAKKAARKVSA
jgi:hypothetical protein